MLVNCWNLIAFLVKIFLAGSGHFIEWNKIHFTAYPFAEITCCCTMIRCSWYLRHIQFARNRDVWKYKCSSSYFSIFRGASVTVSSNWIFRALCTTQSSSFSFRPNFIFGLDEIEMCSHRRELTRIHMRTIPIHTTYRVSIRTNHVTWSGKMRTRVKKFSNFPHTSTILPNIFVHVSVYRLKEFSRSSKARCVGFF